MTEVHIFIKKMPQNYFSTRQHKWKVQVPTCNCKHRPRFQVKTCSAKLANLWKKTVCQNSIDPDRQLFLTTTPYPILLFQRVLSIPWNKSWLHLTILPCTRAPDLVVLGMVIETSNSDTGCRKQTKMRHSQVCYKTSNLPCESFSGPIRRTLCTAPVRSTPRILHHASCSEKSLCQVPL